MLFPGERNPFNYNCDQNKNVVAIIDGVNSQHSTQMATILNVFKIPQLSYGSFDSRLDDKTWFPFFYKMMPNEMLQYIGIVHLLNHFRWTWVGLLVPDDDNGEIVLQKQVLQWALEYNILHEKYHPGKVWIRTAQWDINTMESERKLPGRTLNGTLSFTVHTEVIPGFENFLQTINPYKPTLYLLHAFWQYAFNCSFPSHPLYTTNQHYTGEEKQRAIFEMGMFGQSYSIYNAVYAVAHALHAMYRSRTRHKALRDGLTWSPMNVQPWQLHLFLNKVRFNNSAGEEIFFNNNMELTGGYDIVNWVIYPNRSFSRRQVGKIDSQAPDGKEFTITEDDIVWNPYFNQMWNIVRGAQKINMQAKIRFNVFPRL
nr:PREDICTED: vomeronasal type-2 receptor 26 [Anolis carolinensis]|eukprot:XP_008113681.1 PREDICTED: vomeronasal type-2 receptor 26 [Anolis carolinensis]